MSNTSQESRFDIDYELRRRKLTQIAVDLIAREGIDSATVRRIAAEAGCSTTLITDCFEDKRELFVSAYRLVSTNILEKFERQVALDPSTILDSLVALSAIDQSSCRGWRVHMALSDKAMHDPVLAAEQRACVSTARRCVGDAIKAGYGTGEKTSGIYQVIMAFIHGISIQVLFERQSWSYEQVRHLLTQEITRRLGGEAGVVPPRKTTHSFR